MNGFGAALMAMHLVAHSFGSPAIKSAKHTIQSTPAIVTVAVSPNQVEAPFRNFPVGQKAITSTATTAMPKTVVVKLKPGNEQTLVNLVTSGADMPVLLQMLSAKTKISLVLLTPSETKLTTNLVNVPFIEALQYVCSLSGLSFLKVKSTYMVATKDKLIAAYPAEYYDVHPEEKPRPQAPPEEIVTDFYNANYVSSSQIADVLSSLYPKDQLTIVAGPVQSNPSVSAQDTAASTGSNANVLSKDDSATAAAGKMLIFRGAKSVVESAKALAQKMDVMRPQVAIEVTIYDISDTALRDLGISWTFSDVNLKEDQPKGVNFGSFARAPLSFNGVIKALQQQDKAKLLASPNVSVLDGERAFILIGDRIAYPVLVGYSQNNAPIFSKEEERVGIYMQVAASVSSDDNVTLSLYPQVSSITGFLNVNGASYPQISTREAQTTLRVRSGETIVMGGLLKSEETANYDRIPILSNLPFIGELFKHRKTSKDASQVIISIKPRVIRADESR
jgi:type II secretory pathway component GspD/PulD (secretin)